jgi:hypothetical protein
MKKQIKPQKQITSAKIKKYLKNSDLCDTILWLLSLPKEELSDSMLKAHEEMIKKNQNEMWLAMNLEENFKEEILEFMEWNKIIKS